MITDMDLVGMRQRGRTYRNREDNPDMQHAGEIIGKLIAEVERLTKWVREDIKTSKGPTEWAYQQVSKARFKWHARAEKAEAEVEIVKGWYNKAREETEREARYRGVAEADNRRLQERVEKLEGVLSPTKRLVWDLTSKLRNLLAAIEGISIPDEKAEARIQARILMATIGEIPNIALQHKEGSQCPGSSGS